MSRKKAPVADNPSIGIAHSGMAVSCWAEHKYPEGIQEFKAGSQLEVDRNYIELANALDMGFRSGGWPGAMRKGIEVSLAQRKAQVEYVSPYQLPGLYADLGEKYRAFEWLETAYK